MTIPTVSGGIFNFTTGGYSSPGFSGSTYGFGTVETFYQVWTDDYVYAATSLGLNIYDITSESQYAYVTYSGGFNTVWANEDKVFVGTTNSGVKYINKTCISGSVVSPYDLFTCLNDFSDLTYYHQLTSDNIRYIHGSGDVLCMITNSGVDIVKIDPQSYRSYTTISGVRKGFMTSTGGFYYMTLDVLYVMYTSLYDWTEANKNYTVGSGIFESGIELNDIFVTEQTSSDGISNTIFMATTSGAYIIDEGTENYINFTRASGVHGGSDAFTAIWADTDAGLSANKMYIGLEGYFNVVNLSDQTIYDWYSTSHKGRSNEVLSGSGIVDINVT